MKIAVLNRDDRKYTAVSSVHKKMEYRNVVGTSSQPLATAREYQRAVQAAKMERIFAKPFVKQLQGHLDAVKCLSRCHQSVFDFFSGSCDGEVRYWSLTGNGADGSCRRSIVQAHDGFVEGLCLSRDDKYLFSCGTDGCVKQWGVEKHFLLGSVAEEDMLDKGNLYTSSAFPRYAGGAMKSAAQEVGETLNRAVRPVATFVTEHALRGIDHSSEESLFATAGHVVHTWNDSRSKPLHAYSFGNQNYVYVKWNESESNLLVAGSTDNNVVLIDTRTNEAVQSVQLEMRSNAAAWNPMAPFVFSVASDDSNVYTFDIRNFAQARNVHHGFIHAALSLDYSPAGNELAAGSYDQTIRIWDVNSRRSRDVYHHQRMQSVTSLLYTGDAKFLLSGSADFSIRVWKAQASDRVELLNNRERAAMDYRNALKDKFAHMPEVKKILTSRFVPKYIYNGTKKRANKSAIQDRKQANRQANTPNAPAPPTLRQSVVRTRHIRDAPRPEQPAPPIRSMHQDTRSNRSAPDAGARDSEHDSERDSDSERETNDHSTTRRHRAHHRQREDDDQDDQDDQDHL